MMNLVSSETPPLGRQERVHATTATTTAIRSKEARSSSSCFHGHLDLSLGMSLSREGSGCDAKGCHGTKESDGPLGGGNRSSNEVCCMSSGISCSAIEHSAGHGHVGDTAAVSGWTSAFMPSPTDFMHPWSLAARQQKAAAEHRTPAVANVPSEDYSVILPSALGWPPVHNARRNLIMAMHTTKSDGTITANGPKDMTMPAGNEKNTMASKTTTGVEKMRPLANMFAKVHMEGYAIARKINLRAHDSYESLSRALTKMTRNFFCPADYSSVNSGEEKPDNSDKFIFLYEDFEGDRMLVGDVPWELFLASSKRLYIVRNLVPGEKGHADYDKNDGT